MSKGPLRFDHKEVFVLFSLFIFVSLLMFTVGILVGKGIAQAKMEGALPKTAQLPAPPESHESDAKREGASEEPEDDAAPIHHAPKPAKREHAAPKVAKRERLELIPKAGKRPLTYGSLKEPSDAASQALNDPKLKSVIDDTPDVRSPASALPTSLPKGRFTVQVGSYTARDEAVNRVSALKKLGFPYANFSVKQMDKGETWYRVWLGYFPDASGADRSGKLLQDRGEVKNYIVRRTDSIN